MRRLLLGLCLVIGCDDEGNDGTTVANGTTGSPTSGAPTLATTGDTQDPSSDPSNATTGATQTTATSEVSSTGEPSSTSPSSGSGGSETGSSSSGDRGTGSDSSTGEAGMTFADIQIDLENMNGAQGDYPSCIDGGGACHANPARNVVLISNPDAAELMQNYENILNAPGVPWVTPQDDTAQMLNEVPIPKDVRARWLAWIQAGAPFD